MPFLILAFISNVVYLNMKRVILKENVLFYSEELNRLGQENNYMD